MLKNLVVVAAVLISWASTAVASEDVTVLLGQHGSVEQYRDALELAGFDISPSAEAMLSQVRLTGERTRVELVIVTQRELGLHESVEPAAVFEKARRWGLELCIPEVALALRLRLPAENFQWIDVAMSSLDMNGIPGLFIVGSAAGSGGLYGDGAKHQNLPDMRWVFTRPRR